MSNQEKTANSIKSAVYLFGTPAVERSNQFLKDLQKIASLSKINMVTLNEKGDGYKQPSP